MVWLTLIELSGPVILVQPQNRVQHILTLINQEYAPARSAGNDCDNNLEQFLLQLSQPAKRINRCADLDQSV